MTGFFQVLRFVNGTKYHYKQKKIIRCAIKETGGGGNNAFLQPSETFNRVAAALNRRPTGISQLLLYTGKFNLLSELNTLRESRPW